MRCVRRSPARDLSFLLSPFALYRRSLSPFERALPQHASPGTRLVGGPTLISPGHPGVRPLTEFFHVWKEAGLLSAPWLCRTLRRGYALQFHRKPPAFGGVVSARLRNINEAQALTQEVTSLLQRGAILEVNPLKVRTGFYSPYFLVPKKSGGSRPILDLRVLNGCVAKRPFRMLTVKQLLQCVRPGDWMTSVDLTDAYFHVPIVPEHRKFLRFAVQGRCYEYCRLPFGYSLAPRTFSKCVDAALEPLRRRGLRILTYIDDWLILAPSPQEAEAHTALVLTHISRLGFVVNQRKSMLRPSQQIMYLGLLLDSGRMTASLSAERRAAILSLGHKLVSSPQVRPCQIRSLLGMMAAAHPVVRLGLLHMRNLQRWVSRHKKMSQLTRLSPAARGDVTFWLNAALLREGVPMGQVDRYVEVFTDASLTGWGGILGQHSIGGVWSSPLGHINLLEMVAVQKVLVHFTPQVQGRHVMVRTDNTTVAAYLNRQGGTRSLSLHNRAAEILLWAAAHLASLRARHVPGARNVGADRMSRGGALRDEWSLAPWVAEKLWARFGTPVADLFASAENALCPLWFSLRSTDGPPLGVDAMAHYPWPPGLLYAFPPLRLLGPLLYRVRSEGLFILVVAPDSPGASWYPGLAEMALGDPWPLPDHADSLLQAGGALRSRPVLGRRLMVWKLKGGS